ncbi:alpha/beta fold hydrolase [Amycolatopsis sp. NPDC059657]|uniref:alpha/beta fold hydrolase n=1 Tax=Amycolatopsis sp. NPDC059657 TaxID=3346899 RepID=UPI00367256A2
MAKAPALTSHTTIVDGRATQYHVGGDGPPLLFLHGWGLADRSYRAALQRLVAAGSRVYAPALPGFGGTADLPAEDRSLAGFARWVTAFAAQVGISEPVTLVGHSFGGGVAIRTAHDSPELVARLVLVNSIGGSAWSNGRGVLKAMRERPLWDWGLHLQADLLATRNLSKVLPVILRDAVPNLLRCPGAIWRVANLARTADLTGEIAELNRRRMPVVIVWSDQDNVIPQAALLSLRAGLDSTKVVTVPGRHGWLLAEPQRFGEIITNVLGLAELPTDEDCLSDAA